MIGKRRTSTRWLYKSVRNMHISAFRDKYSFIALVLDLHIHILYIWPLASRVNCNN